MLLDMSNCDIKKIKCKLYKLDGKQYKCNQKECNQKE